MRSLFFALKTVFGGIPGADGNVLMAESVKEKDILDRKDVSASSKADRPLVDFSVYPVYEVLKDLIVDKSAGRNVIVERMGDIPGNQVTPKVLMHNPPLVRLRVKKRREDQASRTKKSAEVFTPSRLCGKMNDFLDSEMPKEDWRKYVDTRVLEITCGEAPFIVSRYDAATGVPLPLENRIGILDRKLRAVNANAQDFEEWRKWTLRAYESVYGYDFLGDSLLIARANLLITFVENYEAQWKRKPVKKELAEIVNRIVWNFWQMDGFDGSVVKEKKYVCNEWFLELDVDVSNPGGFLSTEKQGADDKDAKTLCFVYDWRKRCKVLFNDIGKKEAKVMKFDFAIGNPPYQEETVDTSDKPIYNMFMDGAYEVADSVELITPARFLFNAGKTPKAWNEKMLSDPHLKVLEYIQKSDTVFSNTNIMGGVAITYRNGLKESGAIETFSPFSELNAIFYNVVKKGEFKSLEDIFALQNKWNLDKLYRAHRKYRKLIGSNGRERRLTTSIFSLDVFHDQKENGDVKILGLDGGKRVYKYVRREFLADHPNVNKYKVIVPKSNGAGAIGEVLSTPVCGQPICATPHCGYTQSFLGIGAFDKKDEAENCLKYIKSKFARTMLGILKVTQDNSPSTWRYVPLQDFTSSSDIDWTKSVKEIDRQLYKKYKLRKDVISFIETHVKEME